MATGLTLKANDLQLSVAMSRKHKTRKSIPGVAETRIADALTVGWMLTVITTLACEAGLLAVRAAEHYQPNGESLPVIGDLLLFSSLAFGAISLLLAPVVLYHRRSPVPPGITIFAVAVGLTPLAMVAWRMLGT